MMNEFTSLTACSVSAVNELSNSLALSDSIAFIKCLNNFCKRTDLSANDEITG